KQRPAAIYAIALVLGIALLAAAYTLAIRGLAWSALRYMALTIVLGVAGTLLLFYGLRIGIDRLARRGDRAGKLRVFNFRQVEETVIHRSGTLAICSLLILAALCCFGAGVATARSSRAETHVLDYTFPANSQSADEVRQTLTARGLDGAFSDLFEMRIGRIRTTEDHDHAVRYEALERAADTLPDADERQQLQYLLDTVGYPHLIALSSYNHLLAAAGLPELSLADDEAAVYCDSEVSTASHTSLLNRLIAEGSSITVDGTPFTLVGQVQMMSVVTDRSITMSFALIVPDAVFDDYTQGDYDVYLDGVLAPSMTAGKSLMRAIADMNQLLAPLGLEYESYLQNIGRELFYTVAASYLTIYLAIIFLVVANTIIGVQFLMGQQKAARRYRTLVRLGAEHATLCRSARAQINWYFGLPVGVAAVSSLFGVRALFSGILTASAKSRMMEMMITAGAMILLLCVVEWIYMAAVKRSSSRFLLGLMAPEREE
ncbi:MAG: ABC transporter permease, partial [Oscillospiraceae bacterium]